MAKQDLIPAFPAVLSLQKKKKNQSLPMQKLASEENFPWVQVGSPFLQPEQERELANISKSTVEPTLYLHYASVVHVPLLSQDFLKLLLEHMT